MSAAHDLHRRTETEAALQRLLESPTRMYTRKGLFSRIEKWQEQLLVRMEKSGIVRADRRGPGKPTLYWSGPIELVQQMLDDEDQLLTLVFPSYVSESTLQEILNGEDDEIHEPEPSQEDMEELSMSSDVTPEMLLKMLLGLIEIATEQSGKIASLTALLETQTQQLATMKQSVDRLVKELTE